MCLSPRWRIKRELILKRDQGKCRNCGSREKLQVHHRQYHYDSKTGFHEDIWEYKNKHLITLCDKCHEAGHKIYKIPSFKH